jgi:hypothetical protein
MAMLLKRNGITRVRPLMGGFDGWQQLGYPLNILNNSEKILPRS